MLCCTVLHCVMLCYDTACYVELGYVIMAIVVKVTLKLCHIVPSYVM